MPHGIAAVEAEVIGVHVHHDEEEVELGEHRRVHAHAAQLTQPVQLEHLVRVGVRGRGRGRFGVGLG